MDEATFSLQPYSSKGWYLKGSRPTRRYVLNKSQKIHVFGALGSEEVITKLCPKMNSQKYFHFLRRLKKRYNKLCLIADNACWHKTKKIQQFIEDNGIEMIFLPPYCPELNPIEQFWKNIKQWLGTQIFYNRPELIRLVRNATVRKSFMPPIYDY